MILFCSGGQLGQTFLVVPIGQLQTHVFQRSA